MIRILLISVLVFISGSPKVFASHYFEAPYFTNEKYGFVDPSTVKAFPSPNNYPVIYDFQHYGISDKHVSYFEFIDNKLIQGYVEECIPSVLCNRASVNAGAIGYREITVNGLGQYTAYYKKAEETLLIVELVSVVKGWPESTDTFKEEYEEVLALCQSTSTRADFEACRLKNCLSDSLSYSHWLSCKLERVDDEEASLFVTDASITDSEAQLLSSLLQEGEESKGKVGFFENINEAIEVV
ncbi:hypothetical protein [Thiomicrorhabdus sp.]|uniref:hypothetical protein n=1 Tax=Thiomicrorhabdus sp. TaxID=2039724 RepID=UPI0029C94B95|nr:hypothetical protein [Thiomicrorhabdus sp.]